VTSPYRSPPSEPQETDSTTTDAECTCVQWLVDASVLGDDFPHAPGCPDDSQPSTHEIAAWYTSWVELQSPNPDQQRSALAWLLRVHGPRFAPETDDGDDDDSDDDEEDNVAQQCLDVAGVLEKHFTQIGKAQGAEACRAIMACVRAFVSTP